MQKPFFKRAAAAFMTLIMTVSVSSCMKNAAATIEIESTPAVEVNLDDLSEHLNSENAAKPAKINGVIYPADTTELTVRNSELDDLSQISNLKNLTTLNLEHNLIVDISPLAKLPKLENLKLNSNLIVNLDPLSELKSLKSLDISMNNVRDLSALSGLSSLENLNASWLDIDSVSPIQSLTSLTELDISNTHVTDISPLSSLSKLESIRLNNLDRLQNIDALSGMTVLKSVNLSNNPALSDITAIGGLTGIEELSLIATDIQSFDVLDNFTNLISLEVESQYFNQDNVNMLSNKTKLKTLYLRLISCTDVSPISKLTGLEKLSVTSTEATDFSSFAALKSLKSLNISFSYADSLSFLKSLSETLNELDISGNVISDWDNLTCLKKLNSLVIKSTLCRDYSPIKNMTWLKRLDLSMIIESNYGLPLRKIDYLDSLTNLEWLNLDINRVADITPLQNMKKLKYLSINGNRLETPESFAGLKDLKELRYLDISNNRFSDISPLFEMTQLTTLKISGNKINLDDAKKLTEALVGCAIEYETE